MVEENQSIGRRSIRRALTWAAAAVTAVVASTQVADQWGEVLLGPQQPAGLTLDHGSGAEINRDATLGTVQTVTGNVAQDYSRNVVLYNNDFRVEVIRATDEASAAKQQLRDQILNVLDGLMGQTGAPSLSPERARTLGQQLGTVLDAAPLSPYRLQAREFTLKPGTAYFLPGGDDSFTYVGPAKDGAANTITVRRNGRESAMPVGGVRLFRQGQETCRLLLHEVAADASTATFSYSCNV
jgi:hypothetical protein